MAKYDWGFFFEDGNRARLTFDFGPEHPDNIVHDLDGYWMKRAYEVYPALEDALKNPENPVWLPFAMVIVNPPYEEDDGV